MALRTPLEAWINQKICPGTTKRLTREQLETYQLARLQEVIARVKAKSRFYREHLKHIDPCRLASVKDIQFLPFTRAEQLRENPNAFACVSQREIQRVVTTNTSGTTGEPKRFFYTAADQQRTIDFFRQGMGVFTKSGDRVLIMLPGQRPGSVGNLLGKALAALPAEAFQHNPYFSTLETRQFIQKENITVIVGTPVQILKLARYSNREAGKVTTVRNVLLSTDYVPKAIVQEVEAKWGCRVFNHYGMTEMGLGGGVQCQALAGYHLREADILFEIVDPESGEIVPDGEYGEVVFTSLTAEAMPLVRYRTGDISRFLPEPCACGTVLKSMDIVTGRVDGKVCLSNGTSFWLWELDEALFPLPFVLDFRACLSREQQAECLHICFRLTEKTATNWQDSVAKALRRIPALNLALNCGQLKLNIKQDEQKVEQLGAAKRTIEDLRPKQFCNRH